MVNARLCKKASVFLYECLRHFDFFNCETETSKYFKCELKAFMFLGGSSWGLGGLVEPPKLKKNETL